MRLIVIGAKPRPLHPRMTSAYNLEAICQSVFWDERSAHSQRCVSCSARDPSLRLLRPCYPVSIPRRLGCVSSFQSSLHIQESHHKKGATLRCTKRTSGKLQLETSPLVRVPSKQRCRPSTAVAHPVPARVRCQSGVCTETGNTAPQLYQGVGGQSLRWLWLARRCSLSQPFLLEQRRKVGLSRRGGPERTSRS